MVTKVGGDPHHRLARLCMDLQGYTFSVKHRAGKHHLLPDAVSRLLQADDIAYVNTVDDLRDDFAPLTQDEVKRLMTKYKQDGDYVIETINEFRVGRDRNEKLKDKAFKDKVQSLPVVRSKALDAKGVSQIKFESLGEKKDNDARTWKGPRSALEKLLDEVPSEPISFELMKFLEPELQEAPSIDNIMLSSLTRWDRQELHKSYIDVSDPVDCEGSEEVFHQDSCHICTVMPQVRRSMRLYNQRLRDSERAVKRASEKRHAVAKKKKNPSKSVTEMCEERVVEAVEAALEDYDYIVSNYFLDESNGYGDILGS